MPRFTLVPDKIHPSAADAGDGADNAANGVSYVVVGAGRMVDAVAAGARDPPLQTDDLGDEPIMARQNDLARVEKRQHVPEQIGLGVVADFVADAASSGRILYQLAA